jgi:hypothetical protein
VRLIAGFPPPIERRRHYNWDQILDGRCRELEWGIDFDCRPSSLVVTIRRAARERNTTVVVHSYLRASDDRPVVAVQAVNRET